MPLDKLALILGIVILAAALTVWVGALAAPMLQVPATGWFAAIPALLLGYVVWRAIAERLRNRGNDRYDRLEK